MASGDDYSFDKLSEGLQFTTRGVAEEFISAWCAKNFSPLIVRGSSNGNEKQNGRIQYSCPHGMQRKSKTKGERPLQHLQYTACSAMVNIVQNRGANCWRITKLCKKHNGHMLGPAIYGSYQKVRKMSDADIQTVQDLEGLGALEGELPRTSVIKQVNIVNEYSLFLE